MSGRRFNAQGALISKVGAKNPIRGEDHKSVALDREYAEAQSTAAAKKKKSPRRELSPGELIGAAAASFFHELGALVPDATYDARRRGTLDAFYFAMAERLCVRERVLSRPPIDPELVAKHIDPLPADAMVPEHLGTVHEKLSQVATSIAQGGGRARTNVHFTPMSLAAPIVEKTLEPLYHLVEPARTLELRICDPAVGGGVFLVALVRQMGKRVLEAGLARTINEAKRLVAIHCGYATDICPWAVQTCKRALRLECDAGHMPLDWLEDNIKCGDALVGLRQPEQFKAFHWKNDPQPELLNGSLAKLYDETVQLGVALRKLRMSELSDRAREVP